MTENSSREYTLSPPTRTNGFAIASLICGILGCIPFVSGILAVIFGILGIKKTNQPGYGLKWMAVVGIILGLLGIVGWATFGGGMYAVYRATDKPRSIAKQFAKDVVAGDVNAAMLHTSGIDRGQIEAASTRLKSQGPVQDVTLNNAAVDSSNGNTVWHLMGSVKLSNRDADYDVTLIKAGPDDFKITDFKLGP
jgi:hypothetical protein